MKYILNFFRRSDYNPRVSVIILCWLLVFCSGGFSFCLENYYVYTQGKSQILAFRYFENSDQYRRWEKLSPQERESLRRRYEHYKQLPPEKQQLLKRRYEQWKNLSESERKRLRYYLRNWDKLTPSERNTILRYFKQ